ncbi:MAG: BrnA antitoxin family protein [Acidithiobacillus sp.]
MSMVPSHEKKTENPEWTTENFAKTMPFSRLSDGLRAKLSVRGTQKTPSKERITICLSGEVVERFRASGSGWQTRIDAALREWLETHPQA